MEIRMRGPKSAKVVFLALLVLLVSVPSWAIVVSSTADSGTGSLRDTIDDANSDGVPTTITFDPTIFPPTTPCAVPAAGTITLTSALPNITGPGDRIDGSGACVVLNGQSSPNNVGLRVRASNVTIQSLTIQNFIGNDGVRVEARNATPTVTGVIIAGNTLLNNNRGVRIDGGTQTNNTVVSASVTGNMLDQNISGIQVRANGTGSDGGNTVSAVVDSNTITGKQIQGTQGGTGISIQGGVDIGSNNTVTALVTNNTLIHIPNDGIVANGCSGNATGSNNTVNATIAGNRIAYKNSNAPADFNNNGIVVTGAAGESAINSSCSGNTVVSEVSGNNVSGFKNNNITVGGGDEGTQGNSVQGSVLANHVSDAGLRGINVSGGQGNNHSVTVLISDNASTKNAAEGIRITTGSGMSNTVSVDGIVNNTTSRNGLDGITVRSGILGISGGTPVSGNRSDRNGDDGIDLNSLGYNVSNNRADRNVGCGIALGGNTDGVGNVAKKNNGGDICNN
jgi:hypothetical protein